MSSVCMKNSYLSPNMIIATIILLWLVTILIGYYIFGNGIGAIFALIFIAMLQILGQAMLHLNIKNFGIIFLLAIVNFIISALVATVLIRTLFDYPISNGEGIWRGIIIWLLFIIIFMIISFGIGVYI